MSSLCARNGGKAGAPEIIASRAHAQKCGALDEQHVAAIEQSWRGDHTGERNVEARTLAFEAIRFGAPRHRARPHHERAVLKDDRGVTDGRLIGILGARLDHDRLDAEILERLSQNLVLLERP